MMYKLKRLILPLFGVLVITFSGCASAVLVNPDAEFPLEISESAPVLLFPMSLHGVRGDDAEVGLAISAGVIAEFGTKVISGQQLLDLVGNLSWTLGEGIRKQAESGEFELTGSAASLATEVASVLSPLEDGLKGLSLLDADGGFKYMIVLHVDSESGPTPPGVYKAMAFGGIYEIATGKILSYIEKSMTITDNDTAALALVPAQMNEIIKSLLEGK